MKFSDLGLKTKYDTDEDNILQQFYIPLFGHAKNYDRAVGFFSADVLSAVATGLDNFISSNGKIRLIIGDPLTDDEYEAVLNGLTDKISERSIALGDLLCETKDKKLNILRYLIANSQLEIKFAFTHKGMFHKKIGIFYKNDEIVVFSGSANETLAGLTRHNSEEISVFLVGSTLLRIMVSLRLINLTYYGITKRKM